MDTVSLVNGDRCAGFGHGRWRLLTRYSFSRNGAQVWKRRLDRQNYLYAIRGSLVVTSEGKMTTNVALTNKKITHKDIGP